MAHTMETMTALVTRIIWYSINSNKKGYHSCHVAQGLLDLDIEQKEA